MGANGAGSLELLFSEAQGRVRVSVAGTPEGTVALSVPVRREGVNRPPRNRLGLLRIQEVDLVTACTQSAYDPPSFLESRHLIWVLSAGRRSWAPIASRFKDEAWSVAVALVRSDGVVLRCAVDEDLELSEPLSWRLSHSWALQGPPGSAPLQLMLWAPAVGRRLDATGRWCPQTATSRTCGGAGLSS